jgi:hypothetical protein
MAEETWDHFEHPGVLQLFPEASWSIESDLSWTMRMSGGSGITLTFV